MTRLSLICLCLLTVGCSQASVEPESRTAEPATFPVSATLNTDDFIRYQVDVVLTTSTTMDGLSEEKFRTMCELLITPEMDLQLDQAAGIDVYENGDSIMKQTVHFGAARLERLLENIDPSTHYIVRVDSFSYRLLDKKIEAAYKKRQEAIQNAKDALEAQKF